ncbi:hypothetical protein DV515_00011299 [Chloebia gouldiae]|uniref:Uncharacterized protein n=1 Tax=Chloebia gouldiae TaxID=44316 RepID=A0A3L8S6Q4_CHLGU|nr:hypothetical protein DV515_00011299 [Chloebia gouldiae]
MCVGRYQSPSEPTEDSINPTAILIQQSNTIWALTIKEKLKTASPWIYPCDLTGPCFLKLKTGQDNLQYEHTL